MKTFLDTKLAENYTSASQKIRVLTESWVNTEIFCPSCGSMVNEYENNRPVADFYCPKCREEYELKSKKDTVGNKIVDGAYKTMIERLNSSNNPNFFLLNYDLNNFEILNFFVIPKHFFVPQIIEERNPLSKNARRAGWIGCNISLKEIPSTGKIFYIKNKQIVPKEIVKRNWQKTLFLREEKAMSDRGWTLDVMNCVDKLKKDEFTLDEVYKFEKVLQSKHPDNKHVRDKVRQQLQILRDKGYLEFIGRGKYKIRN